MKPLSESEILRDWERLNKLGIKLGKLKKTARGAKINLQEDED